MRLIELLRTVWRIKSASAAESIGVAASFWKRSGRFAASRSSRVMAELGATSPDSYFSKALAPPPNTVKPPAKVANEQGQATRTIVLAHDKAQAPAFRPGLG